MPIKWWFRRTIGITRKGFEILLHLNAFISYHIVSYHIISHHIISYHIISYHIISYHIISYHIISYLIMSCHVMSCHVMSYHIISYHIISYHIISYHIISYHIILYYIILYDIILYYIILYYIILYYIILYYYTRGSFKIFAKSLSDKHKTLQSFKPHFLQNSSLCNHTILPATVEVSFPGGKGGRCVRLTTSPSSCAGCHRNLGG